MTTPIIAACVCFVSLFVLQNVFDQRVYKEVHYELSPKVMARLVSRGIAVGDFADLEGRDFPSAVKLRDAVAERTELTAFHQDRLLDSAEVFHSSFFPIRLAGLETGGLSAGQVAALQTLSGRTFRHKWQVTERLAQASADWQLLPETTVNKRHNKQIKRQLDSVFRAFVVER